MPHEPYWNAVQSAEYLGFPVSTDRLRAMRAFYEFCRRHNVRKFHRGASLLFRRVDLDAAVGNDRADEHGAPEQLDLRMVRASLPAEPRRRA